MILFGMVIILIYWFYKQKQIVLLTSPLKPIKLTKINTGSKINIVTYNIQKLPWKLKSLKPLVKLFDTGDIILLQECFHEAFESLRKLFPSHYICRAKLSCYRLINCGLVIMSKYPLEDIIFYPFKNSNCFSTDYLCEKGLLSGVIKFNNKKIRIINTHLQASYTKYYDSYTIKQCNELFKFIYKIKEPYYVLGGDFNIDYKDLLNNLNNFNLTSIKFPLNPTIYIDLKTGESIPYPKRNYKGFIYDYFISNIKMDQPIVIPSLYSDHLPIISNIII